MTLVTGANSGIGKAVAIALGEAGADVVVNYRSGDDAAQEVVDKIKAAGSKAYAHTTDVSQEDQVRRCSRRCARSSARSTSWSTTRSSTGEDARRVEMGQAQPVEVPGRLQPSDASGQGITTLVAGNCGCWRPTDGGSPRISCCGRVTLSISSCGRQTPKIEGHPPVHEQRGSVDFREWVLFAPDSRPVVCFEPRSPRKSSSSSRYALLTRVPTCTDGLADAQ